MAPMDGTSWHLHNASTFLFQGGGIAIYGGTVTIDGSSIYGNCARDGVSAHLVHFPRSFFHGPHGRIPGTFTMQAHCHFRVEGSTLVPTILKLVAQ